MKINQFILALLVLVNTAWAGPLEDADAAYRREEYATAMQILRPIAAQGVAAAQSDLGVMYQDGLGVTQDYAEAAKWYKLAAAQGYALAQFGLGVHSIYSLGLRYVQGEGVVQSNVLAYMWWNISALSGNASAG